MSILSVRLPDSIHANVREWSSKEGISINQFVSSAVAEKLAALATEDYLAKRGAQGNRAAFDAALSAVPDVPDEFEQKSSLEITGRA